MKFNLCKSNYIETKKIFYFLTYFNKSINSYEKLFCVLQLAKDAHLSTSMFVLFRIATVIMSAQIVWVVQVFIDDFWPYFHQKIRKNKFVINAKYSAASKYKIYFFVSWHYTGLTFLCTHVSLTLSFIHAERYSQINSAGVAERAPKPFHSRGLHL